MFKFFKALGLVSLLWVNVMAQDAIIIKEGDVWRGLIKGTDFYQVAIEIKEGQVKLYQAKDIEGFVWNGETFLSKPFLVNNKLITRFYRAVESGKINLYTIGMDVPEEPPVVKQKSKPRIGIGIGTGGLGFGGMGSGISIGAGGPQTNPADRIPKPMDTRIRYFIEKPGTGPMLELNFDYPASVKAQLGLKMQDQKEIFEELKGFSVLSPEQMQKLVQKYNAN